MAPTKNPMGRLVWYEMAMAAQTVTSANTTDRPIATGGRLVNDRAAAGRADEQAEDEQGPDDGDGHGGDQGDAPPGRPGPSAGC